MSTTERAKARATASRSPKSTKEDTDFSVSRGGTSAKAKSRSR